MLYHDQVHLSRDRKQKLLASVIHHTVILVHFLPGLSRLLCERNCPRRVVLLNGCFYEVLLQHVSCAPAIHIQDS